MNSPGKDKFRIAQIKNKLDRSELPTLGEIHIMLDAIERLENICGSQLDALDEAWQGLTKVETEIARLRYKIVKSIDYKAINKLGE